MSGYQPLFATSTARSGSYLIAMMLSTSKEMMIASEPYLELFRSLRNALVRRGDPELQRLLPPLAPMQDYYFSEERIRLMDLIQEGSLSERYPEEEWGAFVAKSTERVALQCAELAPFIPRLKGATYKEMFDNGLRIIAEARHCEERKYIGIKDAWTIEFFKPLARAYPEAKFLIILRDPRAVINSMLGVVNVDPQQIAQVISYARHWRKYAAFIYHYRHDPLFERRAYFVTHEQVLTEPEKTARAICAFFEIEFDERMLNTENYHDYSTGKTWEGNSSFETRTAGVSAHRAERWKSKLDPRVVKLIDFICGPDLKLLGYPPVYDFDGQWVDPEIIDYLLEQEGKYVNWRSDLGDLQLDFGAELFRRTLLDARVTPDRSLVRRSFLFEEVYQALRRGEAGLMQSFNKW